MGSVDDNTSGGAYAYRASKSALNVITKSMSIDLEAVGVTSVLLHPGTGYCQLLVVSSLVCTFSVTA